MEGWFFSWGNAHECTMYYSSSHATEASCSCCLAAMQFAVEKQGRLCFWQASRQSVSWTLSTGWKSFKCINQPVVNRSHRPCRTLLISQSWSFLRAPGTFLHVTSWLLSWKHRWDTYHWTNWALPKVEHWVLVLGTQYAKTSAGRRFFLKKEAILQLFSHRKLQIVVIEIWLA